MIECTLFLKITPVIKHACAILWSTLIWMLLVDSYFHFLSYCFVRYVLHVTHKSWRYTCYTHVQVTLRLKTVKIKNNLVYSRFELKAMTLNDVTLYLINLHGDNNMIRMTSFLSSFNSVLMVIGTLLQSIIQTFMKHQDITQDHNS